MQGNEYQKLAMRTNDKMAYHRLSTELTGKLPLSPLTENNAKCSNINDLEHLKKECGDVMWYVAMICEACGFSLDDVMQTNIDKVIARYPNGFDSYRANHRQAGDV